MSLLRDTATKMLIGDARQRIRAVLTLATWFAMGAFVTSVAEHYIDFTVWGEQVAAVVGGSAAVVIALAVKSV